MRLNEKLEAIKRKEQERRLLLKVVKLKRQLDKNRKDCNVAGIFKIIREVRP